MSKLEPKKKTAIERVLGLPVDLKELLDNLNIEEESAATAARNQPRLFVEAHRFFVKKLRKRLQAELQLDFVESDINLKIRWQGKEKDEKRTEPYIKALVTRSKAVHTARKTLADTQVEEAWAKGLTEAYKQRSLAIRAVVDMLGAEVVLENRMNSAQQRELDRMHKHLENTKPERLEDDVPF